jgi:hypothetical protein
MNVLRGALSMAWLRAWVATTVVIMGCLVSGLYLVIPASESASAGPVWGRVSYNGRPLNGGGILFLPIHDQQGHWAGAQIGQNGTYSITLEGRGAESAAGQYKICIFPAARKPGEPSSLSGTPATQSDDRVAGSGETAASHDPAVPSAFPSRFSDIHTTGLLVTLGTEPTCVDIDLKD